VFLRCCPLEIKNPAQAELGRGTLVLVDLFAGRLALRQRRVTRIGGHDQPSGPLHGVAVIGIDRATEQARLVGGAVDASVRPGEFVPAAHFDKPLQEDCHGCFRFLGCI